MRNFSTLALLLPLLSLLFACDMQLGEKTGEGDTLNYAAPLTEMDESKYPDNPERLSAHSKYGQLHYGSIQFKEHATDSVSIMLLPGSDMEDTIMLKAIDLATMMPSAPSALKANDYLYQMAIVNQECNRLQVSFGPELFSAQGKGEMPAVSSMHIAKSCLRSSLWEVILYNNEKGHDQALYHGWFTFPEDAYIRLFEARNDTNFADFEPALTRYLLPDSQHIDFNILRHVEKDEIVSAEVLNDQMYELKGEFMAKFQNILFPTKPSSIHDFHSDSVQFASFVEPGIYSKASPKATQLGRFQQLHQVKFHDIESQINKEKLSEIELWFIDDQNRQTYFIIGGIDINKLPKLSPDNYTKGLMLPIGIGNPPFYCSYQRLLKEDALNNPRYILLTDQDGKWLDSHSIGIDGPIIHMDETNERMIHVYLTSYERHAIVGHIALTLPENFLPETIEN